MSRHKKIVDQKNGLLPTKYKGISQRSENQT